MDKVYDCYAKSLSLLKPNGETIIVGTRWHFGDAYGRIIEDNKHYDVFNIMIRDAEVKNEENELIFENIGLDRKFLDSQKARQGSFVYSCLYRNNPVDPESAQFKHKDFKFYGALEESTKPAFTGKFENLYVTGTIDPAGEGKDKTAIAILGTDANMKMYILDLVCAHYRPSEMIREIYRLNKIYHFKRFGIETTFFRGTLKRDLELQYLEEQKSKGFNSFAIEEFKTRWRKGEGKRQRIESLQPFHERGDLLFPGKTFEQLSGHYASLADQMLNFTPSHMPDSPAWLEQQYIKDFNRRQRHLPPRFRKTLQTALS